MLISDIMKADQNIIPFIEGVKNPQKFILGGHDGIIALGIRVAVKGLGGIHNQGVEKYVGDLGRIRLHQGCFCLLIAANGFLPPEIRSCLLVALDQLDRLIVIITCGQPVRFKNQLADPVLDGGLRI